MVDMGISSNIMKVFLSQMLHDILGMILYIDTLNWADITPTWDLITALDFFTDFDLITTFREVSIENLLRVRLANRGRLLLPTPGFVPFVPMLRPFSPELIMFPDFEFRSSLGTSILHCRYVDILYVYWFLSND